MDLNKSNLIPLPMEIAATGSSFQANSKTKIISNVDILSVHQLGDVMKLNTSFNLNSDLTESVKNTIFLNVSDKNDFGEEGYQIEISEDKISLLAETEHGLFNGLQTFSQLLATELVNDKGQLVPSTIATGTITDKPEYDYRGAMLDVSRHFFQVADVKKYIDYISSYKINHLHLHLSDDQGWRIEIKSWPNLTTHGGSTQVGGEQGGFYTQEEYKDIVKYASERFITIIPEIDMPGHTNAALSSYPELNCDGKAPELYTGMEVGFSTFCTKKEVVYTFIDDVIRELAEMTPGPYIHIGGDESHVTELADYIPFIERTAEIVQKYGKQVIGWDEIAHAELPPNSVVQYWAVAKNAKMGVDKNAKVIMSPASKTYLDMQYDSTTHLGLHWAAYIEIDSAYNWEPSEFVEGITKEDILGVESPLWSETITTLDDIEYMAFPRIMCHAEIGWTPKEKRDWDDFKVRLGNHKTSLENRKIDFYPSKQIPWQ
jgi:hexosaminidase